MRRPRLSLHVYSCLRERHLTAPCLRCDSVCYRQVVSSGWASSPAQVKPPSVFFFHEVSVCSTLAPSAGWTDFSPVCSSTCFLFSLTYEIKCEQLIFFKKSSVSSEKNKSPLWVCDVKGQWVRGQWVFRLPRSSRLWTFSRLIPIHFLLTWRQRPISRSLWNIYTFMILFPLHKKGQFTFSYVQLQRAHNLVCTRTGCRADGGS